MFKPQKDSQLSLILYILLDIYYVCGGFPGGLNGKESACSAGDTRDSGLIPGWEDPLEKEMAAHSSISHSVVSDPLRPHGL